MAVKPTKRKTRPADQVFEARRTWGGRLLVELNALHKTPEWLGVKVGYRTPSSMRQVINGHQGVSREVLEKIIEVMPEMADIGIEYPLGKVDERGTGARGIHKPHEYPRIGPVARRRARR